MQTKVETVRARVTPEIKHDAEQVLASIGMSVSDAIRIFLNQIAIRREFPLELKVPNDETIAAMKEADEVIAARKARFQDFNGLINELEKNSSK